MLQTKYGQHQRRFILATLVIALLPLVLLGWLIYDDFSSIYRERLQEQLKSRAQSHSQLVDIFLQERKAILFALVESHTLEQLGKSVRLQSILSSINQQVGGFLDIGIIDNNGDHVAYVGPYALEEKNYYEQPWFVKTMARGMYISDVFLGYREVPHFVICVKKQADNPWILRATIDSEVFNRLVRTAQVGKTGDAFIVNRQGILQTDSRFHGEVLGDSGVNAIDFGQGTTLLALKKPTDVSQAKPTESNRILSAMVDSGTTFYAGSWLKDDTWLLVITQQASEGLEKLFVAQKYGILIILLGGVAIVVISLVAARISVHKLQEIDKQIYEMNAQLTQSDKLAALGKMAAGLAHEINNPLAIIAESAGWLEDLLDEEEVKKLDTYPDFRNVVDKMEHHVDRARRVIHNMLHFARRMEPRLDRVDVNQVLVQTIDLLQNHARINNIDIKTNLDENLPIISCDQSQLQQVFLNIINNAVDAIGSNGTVKVQTSKEKENIRIQIQDDGPGMPEHVRKKIFDPFFTTKEREKGTGLGLSVTYNIVQQMNGTIDVQSVENKGTTFTIYIPITNNENI
jgi:two-component system NtrC family sensor kinase